jgi:Cu/Ag efflux pump CusA
VPGVADVNSLGGEVRSFEISPDPAALAARGLTLTTLQAALEANNRNDGAGRLSEGEETLLVRAEGAIRPSTTCAPSCSRPAPAASCGSATWPRCASAP